MVVWENLKSLFEKLNEECMYLILRNYESMDRENLFCANHEDIDVLCDDYEKFIQVSGAKRLYGAGDSIHIAVNINNMMVPVDLRCVGDDYYDEQWEKDMIATRKLVTTQSGSWYVMSDENYYYSLVYHVLIQKKEISEDYPIKLKNLAKHIGIECNTKELHLQNLIAFLKSNSYTCPYPEDISVPLNAEFLPTELIRGELTAWEAGRDISYPTNKKIKICNKIQNMGKMVQKYVSGARRTGFLSAFFVGLLMHWKMLLGESAMTTGVGLPGLYIVVLLSGLGIQSLLLTDLFAVKNKIVAGVVGGLVATCPMVAEIFANTGVVMQYCLAQTLAIVSVRIFSSNRRGHIIVSMGALLGTAFFGDFLLLMAMWILCVKVIKEMVEVRTAKNKWISIAIFAFMSFLCLGVTKVLVNFIELLQVQQTREILAVSAANGNRGIYAGLSLGMIIIIVGLILKDRLKRFHILRGAAWGLGFCTILAFSILTGKIYR